MQSLILKIIKARGWSIKYLAEVAGVSYSGARDFLHSIPQRLSDERVARIHSVLDLSESGNLRTDFLYTWSVAIDYEPLAALDSIFAEYGKFEVIPFFAENKFFVSPYWLFQNSNGIKILVRWQKNKYKIKASENFHTENKKTNLIDTKLKPEIVDFKGTRWGKGVELSATLQSGLHLTDWQLERIEYAVPLDLITLNTWLEKPFDQVFLKPEKQKEWTWPEVTKKLRAKYGSPEKAAKKLKLI